MIAVAGGIILAAFIIFIVLPLLLLLLGSLLSLIGQLIASAFMLAILPFYLALEAAKLVWRLLLSATSLVSRELRSLQSSSPERHRRDALCCLLLLAQSDGLMNAEDWTTFQRAFRKLNNPLASEKVIESARRRIGGHSSLRLAPALARLAKSEVQTRKIFLEAVDEMLSTERRPGRGKQSTAIQIRSSVSC